MGNFKSQGSWPKVTLYHIQVTSLFILHYMRTNKSRSPAACVFLLDIHTFKLSCVLYQYNTTKYTVTCKIYVLIMSQLTILCSSILFNVRKDFIIMYQDYHKNLKTTGNVHIPSMRSSLCWLAPSEWHPQQRLPRSHLLYSWTEPHLPYLNSPIIPWAETSVFLLPSRCVNNVIQG